MSIYRKKIDEYKDFVQGQYIKEHSVQKTLERCIYAMPEQENIRTSCFSFLYEQSKFIQKRWWILQGVVLLVLLFLLQDFDDTEYIGRIIGTLATVFVILIIPEIWKNRRFSAVEIERASFYSLRQICAARILLFAMADLAMIMLFFAITFNTMQLSVYHLAINFLIPFNVSGCICFRLLYSRWIETEYIAVFACAIWVVIWSAIVVNDTVYSMIAEPIWLGLVVLSFAYLLFVVRKSLWSCDKVEEDYLNGIRA